MTITKFKPYVPQFEAELSLVEMNDEELFETGGMPDAVALGYIKARRLHRGEALFNRGLNKLFNLFGG